MVGSASHFPALNESMYTYTHAHAFCAAPFFIKKFNSTHTCTQTLNVYMYMHTHLHAHTHTHTLTMHQHTTNMRTHAHTHTHNHPHTHAHTHNTHIHTCRGTHAHTCAPCTLTELCSKRSSAVVPPLSCSSPQTSCNWYSLHSSTPTGSSERQGSKCLLPLWSAQVTFTCHNHCVNSYLLHTSWSLGVLWGH